MSGAAEPVIATRGLGKRYGDVVALEDLNLEVPRNTIFGFLGPNGAGKTTAMKLLLGLTRPSSGRGSVFGLDIERQSVEVRRRVGFLAQEPRFYEHLSARDTLRFAAHFFYQGPKKLIEERVTEMLELVGLTAKADRPIRGFSGGERQRLGIAQAQVNYPDLLILDEPAASLDPMGRSDVLKIMERLRKHTTVFYSTHILDDVERVSDRVGILNQGELVAQAPTHELLRGDGGTTFVLTVREDGGDEGGDKVQSALEAQPWVVAVERSRHSGLTTYEIAVSDEEAAEARLLRVVLEDPKARVVEFKERRFELEEVFMKLVDGAGRVG